ncbi:MAG: flagellar hook-associated protein FlgL [Thermoanaerobacterales bacterium]|nr:flagellar hook-associated protein FlgL [Bacillota bacterium]MDI6906162.1 flagellar hook-associated protein FlgL [Thermoanaerobacterales bacterium]
MRITHNMVGRRMINSVQGNLEELVRAQERMSTGKKINRPSDDPTAANRVMEMRVALDHNYQFTRNITDGLSWLYETDAALGDATGLLQKAREIAVQGASDTLTPEDQAVLARQIEGLIDAMDKVANSQLGGKYIFAGTAMSTKPYTVDAVAETVTYSGNANPIEREVAVDHRVRVDAGLEGATAPYEGVFGQVDAGGNVTGGIFETLFALRNALDTGNTTQVGNLIGQIDQRMDTVMEARVKIGSRTNHLESLKGQYTDQEVRFTGVLSGLEDSDIAKVTIEFSQREIAYRASLSAGARLMQTTLIDFLR